MLRVDVQGCGPDLVMLHGWGMHSAIWADWAESLASDYCVHCVDLPGHGSSDVVAEDTLEAWASEVMRVVPEGAWWLGWSLGGLLAQQAAHLFPGALRGLVLVAGTPRFVTNSDWLHGVDGEVFAQFALQLEDEPERTLTRFLALQVRGAKDSATTLRQLRSRLQQRPPARSAALSSGLKLLSHSDLRGSTAALKLPIHWLLGERDTLISTAMAGDLGGDFHIVPGAGHAPFLSHQDECTACLHDWIQGQGVQHAAV
jgi:pimeloyl-[acyl-carrier protein] methyl ester esterase